MCVEERACPFNLAETHVQHSHSERPCKSLLTQEGDLRSISILPNGFLFGKGGIIPPQIAFQVPQNTWNIEVRSDIAKATASHKLARNANLTDKVTLYPRVARFSNGKSCQKYYRKAAHSSITIISQRTQKHLHTHTYTRTRIKDRSPTSRQMQARQTGLGARHVPRSRLDQRDRTRRRTAEWIRLAMAPASSA